MTQSAIELSKLNSKVFNNSNTYNSNCEFNESSINELTLYISNSWFISAKVKTVLEQEINKNKDNNNDFNVVLFKKIKQYTYDEFGYKLQSDMALTFLYLALAFLMIGTFGAYFIPILICELFMVASLLSVTFGCILEACHVDIDTREKNIIDEIKCLSYNKLVNN